MFMMMRSTLAEFDKQPVKSYNNVMRAYTPHPEAPKDGEEVMGVTFKSCDLDEYNALQLVSMNSNKNLRKMMTMMMMTVTL